MGRKRKPGRPKGSKNKRRKATSKRKTKKRLPPRIKTGKRKGQFRKRRRKK